MTLSLSLQALIAVPAGIGLTPAARDTVPTLLGWKWMSAVRFVPIIALAGIATLSHSGSYMLIAVGGRKTSCAIAQAWVVLLVTRWSS